MLEKFIEVLKYILLGLVQGIAEVLPISSSGHLTICNEIFKISDNSVALNVFLHGASLIAIIIFLRKELWYVIKGFFVYIFTKDEEKKNTYKLGFKTALFLVLSTIPLVLFAVVLKVTGLDELPFWTVGMFLMINACLIFFLVNFKGTKTMEEFNWKDALVIGLFQCLGSFAGISRSGSCLCGCGVRKIEKETSAKYAFLCFVPVVIGALVLELFDIKEFAIAGSTWYLYLISFVVAGVTTYFSFAFLKKIIQKGSLKGFSYYCFTVGLAVLIYALVRGF